MANYSFKFIYENQVITDSKECENFSLAVDHAAHQWYLLQEPGATDPAAGKFIWAEVIHNSTGYTIVTLTPGQMYARKFSTDIKKDAIRFPAEKEFSTLSLQIVLGGCDYQEQLARVLSHLADSYLAEFNRKMESYPLPVTYLNEQDAKRNLQYLAEFLRIAVFQLQGNGARTW